MCQLVARAILCFVTLLLIVPIGTTSAQDPFSQPCAEIFQDQQNLKYQDYGFQTRFFGSGDAYIGFSAKNDCFKVYTPHQETFCSIARWLRFTRFPVSVQVLLNSNIISTTGETRFAVMGYCYEDGVFHTNNQFTKSYLKDDRALNFNNWWPAAMQNHEIMIVHPNPKFRAKSKSNTRLSPLPNLSRIVLPKLQLATSLLYVMQGDDDTTIGEEEPVVKVTATYYLGEDCAVPYFQGTPEGKKSLHKELCAYICLTKKVIAGTDKKCLCFRSVPDGGELFKCALAWRTLIRKKVCPALFPDEGIAVGHTPDTCAGGNPGPDGCFLPQRSACNSLMGANCPGFIADEICYNDLTISFLEIGGTVGIPIIPYVIVTPLVCNFDSAEFKPGDPFNPADPTETLKECIERESIARKQKYCDYVEDQIEKINDDDDATKPDSEFTTFIEKCKGEDYDLDTYLAFLKAAIE